MSLTYQVQYTRNSINEDFPILDLNLDPNISTLIVSLGNLIELGQIKTGIRQPSLDKLSLFEEVTFDTQEIADFFLTDPDFIEVLDRLKITIVRI
jgi:hypothetical protein